jgi:hypothetical protein
MRSPPTPGRPQQLLRVGQASGLNSLPQWALSTSTTGGLVHAMNEKETVESTLEELDDLISELTARAESIAHRQPKDVMPLIAYILSELFGSERGSRSWH